LLIATSSCFLCSWVYSPQGTPCSSSTSIKSKSDSPESSAALSNVTVFPINKFVSKASLTFWSIESPEILSKKGINSSGKVTSNVSYYQVPSLKLVYPNNRCIGRKKYNNK
jgi:hypothetical protein